jgi:hypothetical protein
MRYLKSSVVAVAMALITAPIVFAQGGRAMAPPAQAPQETSKAVKDGGIKVAGWQGKMDDTKENVGLTVNDARLVADGKDLHVTTGPSMTYWNPANKAAGDYTVKATFTESDYMGLNSHPHPYGIVIAGNDLGTAKQSFLYCGAYGDGRWIVRGFGEPQPTDPPAAQYSAAATGSFMMNGARGTANPAINKAAAQHASVTQEIAMSVKGDTVSCSINGTEVASYTKAELITKGKLTSTNGVYGIRFGHNTDAVVKGLTVVK